MSSVMLHHAVEADRHFKLLTTSIIRLTVMIMMEAVRTSEMSHSFNQITQRNIPEDRHLQGGRN
jgi:hypothetical protein